MRVSYLWEVGEEAKKVVFAGLSAATQNYLTGTKESALSRKPACIIPAMTLFVPGDCHSEAPVVQAGMGADAFVLLCFSVLRKHPGFPSDDVCCYL